MSIRSYFLAILILMATACTANQTLETIQSPEATQTMEATTIPLATDSSAASATANPRATPQPTLKVVDTPTAEQEQSEIKLEPDKDELPEGFVGYRSPAISLAYPEEWEVYRGPFPGSIGIGTFSPFYGGLSQGEDSVVVIIMEEISGLAGALTALEEFYLPAFGAEGVLEPALATTINNQEAATATVLCEDEILACDFNVIMGAERGLVLIGVAHTTSLETFGPLFDQVFNSTIIHPAQPPADLAALHEDTVDYEPYSNAELGVSLRHPADWTIMANDIQMFVSPPEAQETGSLLTITPVETLDAMLDPEASLEEIVSQYAYGNLYVILGDVLAASDTFSASFEGQDFAWRLFGSTAMAGQNKSLTILVAAIENDGRRVVVSGSIDDEAYQTSIEKVISSIIVSGRSYELPSDATLIELGEIHEGMWSAGEGTYLAFEAVEDEPLLVVLESLESVAKIEILSPEGSPIPGARDDYVPQALSASVILVEPGQSGRHYARISAGLSGGGRFKLYLFDLGPDTPLAIERVEESLPSGNTDEYVVDGLAGHPVIIQGRSAGAIRLILLDSSGNYVKEHRGSGSNPASLFFIPEVDTNYTIEVTELDGQPMDYELLVVREMEQ